MDWNLPKISLVDYKKHEKVVLAAQFMDLIQKQMMNKSIKRKELAHQLGITTNYLSSIISGKRIPTLELIVAMQFVLGIRFVVKLDSELLDTENVETNT